MVEVWELDIKTGPTIFFSNLAHATERDSVSPFSEAIFWIWYLENNVKKDNGQSESETPGWLSRDRIRQNHVAIGPSETSGCHRTHPEPWYLLKLLDLGARWEGRHSIPALVGIGLTDREENAKNIEYSEKQPGIACGGEAVSSSANPLVSRLMCSAKQYSDTILATSCFYPDFERATAKSPIQSSFYYLSTTIDVVWFHSTPFHRSWSRCPYVHIPLQMYHFLTNSSVIRFFNRLFVCSRHFRQRACRRVRCGIAWCGQIWRKSDSCCTLCIPFIQWIEAPELGYGEMWVFSTLLRLDIC